ncbi:MAG: hypothetical protein WBA23_12410 [Tunicatimonas sp.]|uniref:hypothetical protein n=1 Tax=Tunicatimonas sp. TaxID=1940096 RepID=UPI003C78A28E
MTKYIVRSLIVLLPLVGCNSEDEFINPFTDEEGIASIGAFVRFEETPEVVADGDLPFDQFGNFTLTGEIVDPAGNVQQYELLVALNPASSDVDNYSSLLIVDSFTEDVPVPLSITSTQIASALSIQVADMSRGDDISFQAVTTRAGDGATFGFSNLTNNIFSAGQRSAMSWDIELTDSRPMPTYFSLVPDEDGDVALGGSSFSRAGVNATPLREGETRMVYIEFDSEIQTAPTLSIDTVNGGTLSAVEVVTITDDGSESTVYRSTFTAGNLASTNVGIMVTGAVETAEDGAETMGDGSFDITVDNTAPTYTLSYSAPATDTALAITVTAMFTEPVQDDPTISISGQGVVPVVNAVMALGTEGMTATYLFEPRGEGEVTEGPLVIAVTASDLASNVATADPNNPVLEILR